MSDHEEATVEKVAARTGIHAYGDGIRQSNASPGGGVSVGGYADDGGISLWVSNFYSGNKQVAPLVNHENWLVISDEEHVYVERPITREECLDLAEHFLALAQRGNCWLD